MQRFSDKRNVQGDGASLRLTAKVDDSAKWTDETPNLYRLVLELADARGRVSYYRPQDHGNHDDVRWTLLTDGRSGLLAAGVDGTIEASVTPYDDLDRALYPFARVRNPDWNTLHVDHSVTGVGDTPNPVRPEYQTRPDRAYSYRTLLRPLTGKEARALRVME